MEIETLDPTVAAIYVRQRFGQGRGAIIATPNGAKFLFSLYTHFQDISNGVVVSCTVGGCVVFNRIEQVNKFACIKARMPSWAGEFVTRVVKELAAMVAADQQNTIEHQE